MTKEKVFLTVLLAVVCLFSALFTGKKLSENNDITQYGKAIRVYQSGDYQTAYYKFGAVSGFSSLKQAALFRQARCATLIGDNQTAIKNYSTLLKRFPKSPLYPISEYNLAMLLYERQDFRNAHRHFQHIVKHFQDKEVAIASKYYLGILENKPQLILEYISLSPNGRFAKDAIFNLVSQDIKFTNADNLIIANSYFAQGEYEKALEYYQKTSLQYSWTGYAKTLFKLGKTEEAKQIAIKGLSMYSGFADLKDVYEVIDSFVDISGSKLITINYLFNINPKSKAADYLMFLSAKYSPVSQTPAIYEELYSRFPDGQFSGEALYKTFYAKINAKQYNQAIKLGRLHLSKFPDTNSAPAVMYWLGKVYEKQHKTDLAKSCYKGVITKYPDSYYAMRANTKLHNHQSMFEKQSVNPKPIVFPLNNKSEADFVIKLAKLGDYDFVQELYKNDGFVQSWIEYQKGNYTQSAILAREAMDKLSPKPDFNDVRWRLVYPIHYYDYVKKYANDENSVIILSIIKEESHFNSKAQSPVGAGGLMQLMPATANEIANSYGISSNLFNPESNIHLGCLYYAKIKRALNHKDTSAIMAYNGGSASVLNWKKQLDYADMDDFIEKIPYPETKDYVKKVLKSYWNYCNIYN